jgi:hypothetical protein
MSNIKTYGVTGTLAVSGTAAASTFIEHHTDTIRLVYSGSQVCLTLAGPSNTTPALNTTEGALVVSPAEVEYLSIGAPQSQTVVNIIRGTTTIVDFPEGTGSPFTAGDFVTFISQQTPYNTASAFEVLSVDSTSNVGGYFSTRLTLDWNSSAVADFIPGRHDTELRSVFYMNVIALNGGSGNLYYNQVQVS